MTLGFLALVSPQKGASESVASRTFSQMELEAETTWEHVADCSLSESVRIFAFDSLQRLEAASLPSRSSLKMAQAEVS